MTDSLGSVFWSPTSENEFRQAIANGIFDDESHWVEIKREPGTPSKGNNKEIAKDLASFAVTGGMVIYGIAEGPDGERPFLHPIDLDGLAERIESIGLMRCDPPLAVVSTIVRTSNDRSKGYLVCRIPESGSAPHMVDSVYYGRGDKRRISLDNATVLALHQRASMAAKRFDILLDQVVAEDPVAASDRRQAHLFLVAEPTTPRPEMNLDAVYGDEWLTRFRSILDSAYEPLPLMRKGRFACDLDQAGRTGRRPNGAALYKGLTAEGAPQTNPDGTINENIIEVEMAEDGGVRIFLGRFGDTNANGEQILLDVAAPVLSRRMVHVAKAISDSCGYFGNWMLGVAATGIGNHRAHQSENSWLANPPIALEGSYRATALATYAELGQRPGALTAKLTGRLLRSLEVIARYQEFLTDDVPELKETEIAAQDSETL